MLIHTECQITVQSCLTAIESDADLTCEDINQFQMKLKL
jgi:hypothetical protein